MADFIGRRLRARVIRPAAPSSARVTCMRVMRWWMTMARFRRAVALSCPQAPRAQRTERAQSDESGSKGTEQICKSQHQGTTMHQQDSGMSWLSWPSLFACSSWPARTSITHLATLHLHQRQRLLRRQDQLLPAPRLPPPSCGAYLLMDVSTRPAVGSPPFYP